MVHENFRWQKPMRELKAASAEIGPIFFGRIQWRTPYDVYHHQPYLAEEPRFILMDVGVHLLDLARFFMGEFIGVSCVARRVNPHIRGEDAAACLLRSERNAACVVELSYASQLERDWFPQTLIHLEGEDGVATLGADFELSVTRRGKTTKRKVGAPLRPWFTPPAHAIQDSVLHIQQHWVECLREGREPETSGEDNLRTLALVFGAYDSAESGQTVSLS
jgi:predicted dehydrogenase